MAQRRMFSLKIIDSDLFLDMPISSQLFYFHLSMRADDDGFVSNPKKIMKYINCSDDDMKILLAKKFVIPFESGIVLIKDWKIHNYIQKDRYQETHFLQEKSMIIEADNGSYELDTKCIQDVHEVDTQVRLGKVSSVKDRYKERVMLTSEEYQMLLKKYGSEERLNIGLELLNNYIQAKEPKYKSHYHVMIGWVHERVMNDEKSRGFSSASFSKDATVERTEQRVSKFTTKKYL